MALAVFFYVIVMHTLLATCVFQNICSNVKVCALKWQMHNVW